MRLLTIFLFTLLLTGCSYISPSASVQNRDKEYLTATSIPPLRTPPGTNANAFHSYYPVADNAYAGTDKKVNLIPPGLNS
jgi:uncharacterized lipoprotein